MSNLVPRRVQWPSEIEANLMEFNRNAESNANRARDILLSTTYWVFDEANRCFGPNKFVGYCGMTFPLYERLLAKRVNGEKENAFQGGKAKEAVQDALDAQYKEQRELHKALQLWAKTLLGDRFTLGDSRKWKFITYRGKVKSRKSSLGAAKQHEFQPTEPPNMLTAVDIHEPPGRKEVTEQRIIRDSALVRRIKDKHGNRCQLCDTGLELANGDFYAEAHHLQPLGGGHDGPDIEANVLVVCPNCHALLDFGAIRLTESGLKRRQIHGPSRKYIEYHNTQVFQGRPP